jgi:hypothetical protein
MTRMRRSIDRRPESDAARRCARRHARRAPNVDGSKRKKLLIADGNLSGSANAGQPCRYTER